LNAAWKSADLNIAFCSSALRLKHTLPGIERGEDKRITQHIVLLDRARCDLRIDLQPACKQRLEPFDQILVRLHWRARQIEDRAERHGPIALLGQKNQKIEAA
jgi:hypothetical protein